MIQFSKPNTVKIVSDGTSNGTKIVCCDADGAEMPLGLVQSVRIFVEAGTVEVKAEITTVLPDLDFEILAENTTLKIIDPRGPEKVDSEHDQDSPAAPGSPDAS